MAALPASLLTRGKAGSAHIFHSSSHAGRLTGSVSSHRSAVQQQVVISLWFWQFRKPFVVSHRKLSLPGCSVFVSAVAVCLWKRWGVPQAQSWVWAAAHEKNLLCLCFWKAEREQMAVGWYQKYLRGTCCVSASTSCSHYISLSVHGRVPHKVFHSEG